MKTNPVQLRHVVETKRREANQYRMDAIAAMPGAKAEALLRLAQRCEAEADKCEAEAERIERAG